MSAATVVLLDQGCLGDEPLAGAGFAGQGEPRRAGSLADDGVGVAGVHGPGMGDQPVPAAVVLAGVGAGPALGGQRVDADGGVAVGGADEFSLASSGVGVAHIGAGAAGGGEDGRPVGGVGGTGIYLGVPGAQRGDIRAGDGVGVGPVQGGWVDGQDAAVEPLDLGGVDAVVAGGEAVVGVEAGGGRYRGAWSGLAAAGVRGCLSGCRGAGAAQRESCCGEDGCGGGFHGGSFRVSGDSFDEGDGAPDGLVVDAGGLAVSGDHHVVAGVDGDVVVGSAAPEEEVAGLGLGEAVDGCAVAGLGVGEVGKTDAQAGGVLLCESGAVVASVGGSFSSPDVGVAVIGGDGLCPGDGVSDVAAGSTLSGGGVGLVVRGIGRDDLDIVLGLAEGGYAAGVQDGAEAGVVGGQGEGDGVAGDLSVVDGGLDLSELVTHVMPLCGDGVGGISDVGGSVAVVVLTDRRPRRGHELRDSSGADRAGDGRVPAGFLGDLGRNESWRDALADRPGSVDQVAVLGRHLVRGSCAVRGGGLRLVEQGDDADERQEQSCSRGNACNDLLHGDFRFSR